MSIAPYPRGESPMGQINEQTESIMNIVQADAQGQDVSQFDPQSLSAAKQYVTMKANELNKMVKYSNHKFNYNEYQFRLFSSSDGFIADKSITS